MARKSKAQMALESQNIISKVEWRVGAYLRLSVENSGGKTEDTIENQRAAVLALIDTQPDMLLHDVYCDNGETGTDFDRPAFDQLMTDLRHGVINCVVVKDLSRFGRNYLEAGTLIEQTFPAMGVRFVAIQDGFDTINARRSTEGYIIPLRNILNDIYAKDISMKTGSALRIKQQQGDFIGAWAAYGYRKDPRDKHRLIVDESAAAVVRRIFVWKAQGMGNQAIARLLTEQKVPSPSVYRHYQKIVKLESLSAVSWQANTVKSILQNEVYLGHMVQGRKRCSLYLAQKRQVLPPEEWIVVRDTHPAIVEQKLFDAAQAVLQERAAAYNAKQVKKTSQTENPLRGLLFCGSCGSKLFVHKSRNRRKDGSYGYYYEYICPRHPVDCNLKGISAKKVLDAVRQAARVQLETLLEARLCSSVSKQESTEKKVLNSRLARRQNDNQKLVESLAKGELTRENFMLLRQECKAEIERLQARLNKIEQRQDEQCEMAAQPLIEQLQQVVAKDLSWELGQILLDRVVVGLDKTIEVAFRHPDKLQVEEQEDVAWASGKLQNICAYPAKTETRAAI